SLEPGEPFGGRLRPGEFLMVERDAAVDIVDGDETLVETAFLDRLGGALLAFEAERVDILAGDAFHPRDRVAAHALVRLRMDLAEFGIARADAERAEARRRFFLRDRQVERHHVGAAGDDAILEPRHDLPRGEADRGDAAAAEAIERHAAGLHV